MVWPSNKSFVCVALVFYFFESFNLYCSLVIKFVVNWLNIWWIKHKVSSGSYEWMNPIWNKPAQLCDKINLNFNNFSKFCNRFNNSKQIFFRGIFWSSYLRTTNNLNFPASAQGCPDSTEIIFSRNCVKNVPEINKSVMICFGFMSYALGEISNFSILDHVLRSTLHPAFA